jgi:L-cysteate sulfo-lyase
VLPNASSGTHAGLAAGFAALGRDPGILRAFTTSAPAEQARRRTLDFARATFALLRPDPGRSLALEAIDVAPDQLGDGYGIPTAAMFAAVRLLGRTEGLLLDPVYGGKAFAGLLADVRAGTYPPGAAVLFLMTGGTPGLFAYRPAFDDLPG